MSSRQIGQYRVTGRLGSGGMGEVYLARDTKLDREIALKLLPSDLADDLERRKRFLREAKAASAISHPNVCVIHEVGETGDGQPFIAMELVRGQTLELRMRALALSIEQIIDIGVQVSDALDAAHLKGIVHRDIKPSNISVDDRGRVKVLDFGLARRSMAEASTESRDQTELATHSGQVIGTPSYMSPEQSLGKQVDQRSDLFSLGVVLYQLITNRLPFRGSSLGETLEAIVHAQPEAIARFNYAVPAELERVVLKCLEKDPNRRFQSARELHVDLSNLKRTMESSSVRSETAPSSPKTSSSRRSSWLMAGALVVVVLLIGTLTRALLERGRGTEQSLERPAGSPDVHSKSRIAVLPLDNIGADPDNEYFAEGMTEELIVTLSKIHNLAVIARRSVMSYRHQPKSISVIGQELQVGTILEGSVRRSGDRLLIAVQLTDVESQANLWSDTYDRELNDVFTVQREVARKVADTLRITLLDEERNELSRPPTGSFAAYDRYLLGRYFWEQRGTNLLTAVYHFNEAAKLDTNYARAYAGLADCYLQLSLYGYVPRAEGYPQARDYAVQALSLDDSLGEAYASLASIYENYDWNFPAADEAYKKALALDPNYPTAHHYYAFFLLTKRGLAADALDEIRKALSLDPRSLIINSALGDILYSSEQFNEAILQYQKTIAMDPQFPVAVEMLGTAYLAQGDTKKAIPNLERALKLSGGSSECAAFLSIAYSREGMLEKAEPLFTDVQARFDEGRAEPFDLALVHAAQGNLESALSLLKKARTERSVNITMLLFYPGAETLFGKLQSYPGFQDFLTSVRRGLASQ